MDANINALNKILPCTKILPLDFRYGSDTQTNIGCIYARYFQQTTDKMSEYAGIIPFDFLAGSDVDLYIKWFAWTDQSTGSDKAVIARVEHNKGRDGVIFGADTEVNDIVITVPDGELRREMHTRKLITISGLVKGDHFGMRLHRDADDAADTYDSNWAVALPPWLEYPADKIGELI